MGNHVKERDERIVALEWQVGDGTNRIRGLAELSQELNDKHALAQQRIAALEAELARTRSLLPGERQVNEQLRGSIQHGVYAKLQAANERIAKLEAERDAARRAAAAWKRAAKFWWDAKRGDCTHAYLIQWRKRLDREGRG